MFHSLASFFLSVIIMSGVKGNLLLAARASEMEEEESFRPGDDGEERNCVNLASRIDRSMGGQCPALYNTLTMAGASGGALVVFAAYNQNDGWHNSYFVGIPKCGSATMLRFGGVRLDISGARPFMGYRPYPKAATKFFTAIRDPLQRFISAYYELHHKKSYGCSVRYSSSHCWALVGESPLALVARGEDLYIENLPAVLERLEALVAWIEKDGFFDIHVALQSYYLQRQLSQEELMERVPVQRVPDDTLTNVPRGYKTLASYEIVPLEHVYDLKCLDRAIEDTNISTKLPTVDYTTHKIFHMHEHGSYTQHVGLQPLELQSKMLPGALARRICAIYEADYCCLGLEMSPECEGFVPNCEVGSGPCATRGSLKTVLWHHPHVCEKIATNGGSTTPDDSDLGERRP